MACDLLDRDNTFVVQDYGPEGYVGTAEVNLQHGLRPGAVISVVTKTSDYLEVNIKDIAGNVLIHVVARIQLNSFALNSYFDGVWGPEEKIIPVPVHKNVRTVTTLVYHGDGYRLFLNGKEITFYKHRSTNMPHLLQVTKSQIYKILYFTTREILP